MLLVAAQASCIGLTGKLRVGPTVDFDGNAAVQADVAVGFGYATSTQSGVTGSLGVGTGSRNYLELTDTIEYHRLEKDYGWRTGVRADIGLVGDKAVGGWIHGAILLPLKQRSSHGGHEKGFHTSMRSRWSVGLESRFGYLSHEVEEDEYEAAAAFGAAITLEWHSFSTMR